MSGTEAVTKLIELFREHPIFWDATHFQYNVQVEGKMFFDMILLNFQHGGRFGIVWVAGTRGVKFIKKQQIYEVNIVKLCDELELFIISESMSPKKRFSLKMSTILINGAIKIFREQAILLQKELFSLINIIHIPTVSGSVPMSLDRSGLFETPPTPVPKVKKQKKNKKIVADTPDALAPTVDTPIQLPNIEDIFRPLARTDDISIRDEICKLPELQDEDIHGLGVLTLKEVEEEMKLMRSGILEVPTIHPEYPSSESLPPPAPIEVIVQVHVPTDNLSNEDQQLRAPETTEKSVDPTLTLMRDERPITPVVSEIQPSTETREALQDIRPIETIPPVVEEVQSIVELTEMPVKSKKARKSVQKSPVVVQLKETGPENRPETKKIREVREKLFLSRHRNTFVRINRCNENEGQFVDESCQLPTPFKNIVCENLYEFWYEEEEMEPNAQIRGVSTRSLSVGDSVGLRRTGTLSAQMSGLDTPSILEPGSRQSLQPLDLQVQASPPIATGKHVAIEEPPVPLHTPRKRKRLTINEDQQVAVIEQQTGLDQITVAEPALAEIISEPLVLPEQLILDPLVPEQSVLDPLVPEQSVQDPLQVAVKEIEIQAQPTSEEISKEKQRASKERQQKIVNRVAKSNPLEGFLTIEDVCEKPINKLNIARAFSDLLTLAKYQFVTLNSEEDSLELKSIEKGPKFLRG